MKDSITKISISKVIGVSVWLVLWQIIALAVDNIYIVPSPIETLTTLFTLLTDPKFIKSIGLTLMRVFIGFSVSAILGIGLGILSGLNSWIHDVFKPFVVVTRTTPVISVILIILIWISSEMVPIVIAFLMCFPIVWTNAYEGVTQTDPKLLEMAKSFKVPKKEVLRGIYLPSLRPYIFASLNTTIGISWKVTVAAEVISFPKFAIGARLYESKLYVETPEVFAWTLVVVCLSLMFEYFVKYNLKRFKGGAHV